ncbi:class E sortase [Kribbella capetownensis]|nr:class E sortase [Kribbella capetownensis]
MRGTFRGLGIVLLVAGLGLLGWVGRQYAGTGAKPMTEEPIVLVRIPKFGQDWEKPVVEGVGTDDLARGIGHYPHTQLPGLPGNFAIAGHRVAHGSPFRKLLDLRKGDQVIVETTEAVYTYELDGSPRDLTVKPTDNWVLDPVPGKPGETATKSTITLTTSQDLFRSPDRSVAFGHLVRVMKKT